MYNIDIQFAVDKTLAPKASLLRMWAKKALAGQTEEAEVTIRIVAVDEMTTLNSTYRHKNGPTNVLSFPFTSPKSGEPVHGDIAICADVVNREAHEQEKTAESHWAHMVVHGIYHLLGYDHIQDNEAEVMEALEIETLKILGFANPYGAGEDIKQYD